MIRQANCIKRGLVTSALSLEARANESLLVRAIFITTITTAGYLAVKIDNVSVGFWRRMGKRGNELGGIRSGYVGYNLMDLLVKRGLPFSLPIAEGQTLNLSAGDGAGSYQILYDIYDAGDIRPDMPNGTDAKTFAFMQYLRESAVLTASGDMLLDTSITPAEFPDFPAGRSVPANMEIKLHGIHGCPVADYTSGSNGFYSTYLKLVRERTVLFDEDRLGIQFLGNSGATGAADYQTAESLIGSGGEVVGAVAADKIQEPYWFDPPLVFGSGEELLIYMSFVKVGTHTMAADLSDIGLILEVNKK